MSGVLAILEKRGWISLSQFSALTGISYYRSVGMLRKGEIQAVHVGPHWRIYRDEVARFLPDGVLPKQ